MANLLPGVFRHTDRRAMLAPTLAMPDRSRRANTMRIIVTRCAGDHLFPFLTF
jgi:hypothetical protein